MTVNASPVRWQDPPSGIYKTNWDAAIDKRTGRIGIGIIARNSQGRDLVARGLTLSSHADPSVAEAWVALYAVMLSKDSSLLDIILEGDVL
jgi:hypothetical protein